MKNVLTAAQVRAAEEYAMSKGVTQTFLRFSASLAVADIISEHVGRQSDKRIAVFCGSGGNGCDGLLVANRLHTTGYSVTAYVACDINKIDGEILAFAKNAGVKILPIGEYAFDADLIVDAIFGIGLNKPIAGEIGELIEKLNAQKGAFKLALDVPSGLNCDTGEVMGVCFKADETVTFSCYKAGMLFGKGRDVCGKIIVKEVGIPAASNIYVYEDEDFPVYAR
ncbi:MAG: NAD(P)H-hydrate epimerase, partial [Clostridiales bacterium]|nr:NAD(P)H-hydrate epimerase [Clostridiales bacterium]